MHEAVFIPNVGPVTSYRKSRLLLDMARRGVAGCSDCTGGSGGEGCADIAGCTDRGACPGCRARRDSSACDVCGRRGSWRLRPDVGTSTSRRRRDVGRRLLVARGLRPDVCGRRPNVRRVAIAREPRHEHEHEPRHERGRTSGGLLVLVARGSCDHRPALARGSWSAARGLRPRLWRGSRRRPRLRVARARGLRPDVRTSGGLLVVCGRACSWRGSCACGSCDRIATSTSAAGVARARGVARGARGLRPDVRRRGSCSCSRAADVRRVAIARDVGRLRTECHR